MYMLHLCLYFLFSSYSFFFSSSIPFSLLIHYAGCSILASGGHRCYSHTGSSIRHCCSQLPPAPALRFSRCPPPTTALGSRSRPSRTAPRAPAAGRLKLRHGLGLLQPPAPAAARALAIAAPRGGQSLRSCRPDSATHEEASAGGT